MRPKKNTRRARKLKLLRFWSILLTVALLTTAIVPNLMVNVNAADEEEQEIVVEGPIDDLEEEPIDLIIDDPPGDPPKDNKEDVIEEDDDVDDKGDVEDEVEIIHTITFSVNGSITKVNVPNGKRIPTESIPPTKVDGKEFVEWQKEGEAFDITQPITGESNLNINLVAKLKSVDKEDNNLQIKNNSSSNSSFVLPPKLEEYTITYVLGAAATNHPSNPTTYTVEDTPVHFLAPTSSNPGTVFFIGWKAAGSDKLIFSLPQGATGDITLTAQWYTAGGGTTYLYDGQNVITIMKLSGNSNSGVGKYAVLVEDKDGHIIDFLEFEAPNGTKNDWTVNVGGYQLTFSFQGNKLTKGSEKITFYPVRYNPGNHGAWNEVVFSGLAKDSATPGLDMLLQELGKQGVKDYTQSNNEGWVFVGWSPDISPTVTTGVTYIAQWMPKNNMSYTVKHLDKDTGEEIAGADVINGQVFESVVTKDQLSQHIKEIGGYEFVNHSPDELQIGTGNNVVNFFYSKVIIHTVTFIDHDGKTLHEEDVPHGEDATAPDDPTRNGHTFTGWDRDFTNVTEDIIVQALYDVHIFTITFEAWTEGGTLIDTLRVLEKVEYGTVLPASLDIPEIPPVINNYYLVSAEDAVNHKVVDNHTFVATYKEKTDLDVKIIGNKDTFIFNGEGQSVTGYTVWVNGVPYATPGELLNEWGLVVTLLEPEADSVTARNANPKEYRMGLNKDAFHVQMTEPSEEIKYNLNVQVEDGWLKINPFEITVSANDLTITYGDDLPSVKSVELSSDKDILPNGYKLKDLVDVTFNFKKHHNPKDAGDYEDFILVTARVGNGNNGNSNNGNNSGNNGNNSGNNTGGNDITQNFIIKTENADLHILQKGQLKVEVEDSGKVYGEADPDLSQLKVTVFGETKGKLNYTISRQPGEKVDEYEIIVTVLAADNPNYDLSDIEIVNGTFKITPRPAVIKVNGGYSRGILEADPEFTAEVEQGVVGSGKGFLEEPDYVIRPRDPGEDAGFYNIPISLGDRTATGDKDITFQYDNYMVTLVPGTLTIQPNKDLVVTVAADGGYKVYDGDPLIVGNDAYHTSAPEGMTVAATTSGNTIINVSESGATNVVTGVEVKIGDFVISNSNITVLEKPGSLWIAKRPVTLTSGSREEFFNGYPLTNEEASCLDKVFMSEVETLIGTGEITNVGTTTNPIEYALEEGYSLDNYIINLEPGTLTVNPRPVTITVNSHSKVVGTADQRGYGGYSVVVLNEKAMEATALATLNKALNGLTITRRAAALEERVGLYKERLEVTVPEGLDNFTVKVMKGDFEIVEETPGDPRPVVPGPVIPGPVDPTIPDDDPVPPVTPVTPFIPGPVAPVPESIVEVDPVVPTPAPTPTEPTTPAEITDEMVPTSGLADDNVPLANRLASGEWALLNLILTILTAIGSAMLWILYFVNKRKEEEEEDEEGIQVLYLGAKEEQEEQQLKRHGLWRIMSIVPAITAIVVFILTEDMTLKMVWTDRWTIIMAIIALVQVIVMILAKKKYTGEDPEDPDGVPVKAIK